jgi:hypothetical protein
MDTVRFAKYYHEFAWAPPGGVLCAEIILNGIPLVDIVAEYSKKYMVETRDKEAVRNYAYNYADTLYYQLTDAEGQRLPRNRFNPMICTCGEAGCSALDMTIGESEDEITWSNGQDRKLANLKALCHIDYSKFPVFYFSKDKYWEAVDDLKSFALPQK